MTISFSWMVLTQTFIQCVGNSCTRHWLWKNDELIFVTNVSSQWKQLYFSDCFHSSRRAEEATWYLHLPSVGSLLLALSCLQQPQSSCFSGKKSPQMALMKAGILSCLQFFLDAVSGSSLQILLCNNGTLFLTGDLWGVHEDAVRLRNSSLSGG